MLGDICAGSVGRACGRAMLGHSVGLLAHSRVADISIGSLITGAVRQTSGSARASLVGGRSHGDRMDLGLGTRCIGRSDRVDDTCVRGGRCRILGPVGWMIRLVGWLIRLISRIFGVVLGVVRLVAWVLRLMLRVFGFAIPILIVRWGVVVAVVPIVFVPVGSANGAGDDAQSGKDGKESRVHGLEMGRYSKKYESV